MPNAAYYSSILKLYPETISKEQLYKLCHISKRVAKYYLDQGVIPCINTGHATYKYKILTKDVIAFLKKRDRNPEAYHQRDTRALRRPAHKGEWTEKEIQRYQKQVLALAARYPDLMTVDMVVDLTGYTKKTIFDWVASGKLRAFRRKRKYYIPKELVTNYMLSDSFREIGNKCVKHNQLIAQAFADKKEDKDHE